MKKNIFSLIVFIFCAIIATDVQAQANEDYAKVESGVIKAQENSIKSLKGTNTAYQIAVDSLSKSKRKLEAIKNILTDQYKATIDKNTREKYLEIIQGIISALDYFDSYNAPSYSSIIKNSYALMNTVAEIERKLSLAGRNTEKIKANNKVFDAEIENTHKLNRDVENLIGNNRYLANDLISQLKN